MITFIKILEYPLRSAGENVYEYTAEVASQKIDPPSLKQNGLVIGDKLVLHSPLKRAVDCIQKLADTNYLPMDELKEIPFDLKKMSSQADWNKYKSEIIRRKFKEMFLADSLMIPRKQIFNEIRKVVQKCQEHKNENITVVSHSFRLKIIEAFIFTEGQIETIPELINNFIKDEQRTYDFGGGFKVEIL